MREKIKAILSMGWSHHEQLFAVQLLASSRRIRDEWFAAGYRFPWENDDNG